MVVNIKPENEGKKSEQKLADQFQAVISYHLSWNPKKMTLYGRFGSIA